METPRTSCDFIGTGAHNSACVVGRLARLRLWVLEGSIREELIHSPRAHKSTGFNLEFLFCLSCALDALTAAGLHPDLGARNSSKIVLTMFLNPVKTLVNIMNRNAANTG